MPRESLFLPAKPALTPEERALPVVHGDPRFALFQMLMGHHPRQVTNRCRWLHQLPEPTREGLDAWAKETDAPEVACVRAAAAVGTHDAWRAWEEAGRPWPATHSAYSAAREAATREGGPLAVLAWSAVDARALGRVKAAAVQRRGTGLGLVLRERDPAGEDWLARERWAPVAGPGADALRALADAAGDGPLCTHTDLRHVFARKCKLAHGKYVRMQLREAYEAEGLAGLAKLTGWPYDELPLAQEEEST
jgi:hypothetical protein